MAFLKSALSRLSHKQTPVVATNMSIDSWCHQLRIQPTRFITKVEICTARTTRHDARSAPIEKSHSHTLLRVSLVPTAGDPGSPEDVLLIERILSAEGAYHSVTPLFESCPYGGSLFRPEIHDRICVVSDGPPTARAHHLNAERTLAFGDSGDSGGEPGAHQLTLTQFAQILDFVSRMTMLICAGGDCQFQSRSFAFTCLAALTPSLPPSTLPCQGGEGASVSVRCGSEWVDDSVFEVGAETFLGQVPWLARDHHSMQALRLVKALKVDPHQRMQAGVCY